MFATASRRRSFASAPSRCPTPGPRRRRRRARAPAVRRRRPAPQRAGHVRGRDGRRGRRHLGAGHRLAAPRAAAGEASHAALIAEAPLAAAHGGRRPRAGRRARRPDRRPAGAAALGRRDRARGRRRHPLGRRAGRRWPSTRTRPSPASTAPSARWCGGRPPRAHVSVAVTTGRVEVRDEGSAALAGFDGELAARARPPRGRRGPPVRGPGRPRAAARRAGVGTAGRAA